MNSSVFRRLARHAVPLVAGLLCLAATAAEPVAAYPSRAVKLIVPYAAGGTTDIVGRILAEALSRRLGQAVVVDNRNGSGGVVGANALAKAPPDGYTLGIATVSTLATAPAAMRQIPYDPIRDFVPVSNVAVVPNVVTVNPRLPAQDMAAFIALLKANPGKYSFASSGTGSIAHMDGELFKSVTGTDMVHVPYRGSGPAINDTIAGQVAAQFDNLSSSLSFIQSGMLRALAVAAPRRLPELPNVPTYAELGLAPLNNMAWFGLVAPAHTPAEFVRKLNEATVAALKDPEVLSRLKAAGALPDAGTPAQFAGRIAKELETRKRIATQQHIVLE